MPKLKASVMSEWPETIKTGILDYHPSRWATYSSLLLSIRSVENEHTEVENETLVVERKWPKFNENTLAREKDCRVEIRKENERFRSKWAPGWHHRSFSFCLLLLVSVLFEHADLRFVCLRKAFLPETDQQQIGRMLDLQEIHLVPLVERQGRGNFTATQLKIEFRFTRRETEDQPISVSTRCSPRLLSYFKYLTFCCMIIVSKASSSKWLSMRIPTIALT